MSTGSGPHAGRLGGFAAPLQPDGKPAPLQSGKRAPDFTLPAGPGRMITLGDYAAGQPCVLLFFPLAYSGVCTRELCDVGQEYELYRELKARVLAISVDSVFVVQRFALDYELPFPVLSDFNRSVIPHFGVLDHDFWGSHDVAYRSAFVLDGAGVVRWSWASEDGDVLPPFPEIKATLESLRG